MYSGPLYKSGLCFKQMPCFDIQDKLRYAYPNYDIIVSLNEDTKSSPPRQPRSLNKTSQEVMGNSRYLQTPD